MCRISTKEKYEEAIGLLEQWEYQENKTTKGDFESGYASNYLFQKTPKGIAVYNLSCFKALINIEMQRNIDLNNINPKVPRFRFNFHGFEYLCEFLPFDEFDKFRLLETWTFKRYEEKPLDPKDVVLEEHVSMMIEKNNDPIFSIEYRIYNNVRYAIISKKNDYISYDFDVLEFEKELKTQVNILLNQQILQCKKSEELKNPQYMYDTQLVFLNKTFLVQYTYKNGKPSFIDIHVIQNME